MRGGLVGLLTGKKCRMITCSMRDPELGGPGLSEPRCEVLHLSSQRPCCSAVCDIVVSVSGLAWLQGT